MQEIWEQLLKHERSNKACVLITQKSLRGSAPAPIGAKAVVNETGVIAGTIGGGKLEFKAIEYAQALLKESTSNIIEVTWNLQKDVKMTCGGEVSLIFEVYSKENFQIAVFGAGHVSIALTKILSTLNCKVFCIDPRRDWLDKVQGENIECICMQEPEQYVQNLSEDTFFVSITKGHQFDIPILAEIYKHFPNAPFVGVIGSKSKSNIVKSDLKKLKIDEQFIQNLKIPLGLAIGSNAVAEIAISISAQILQERDKLQKS